MLAFLYTKQWIVNIYQLDNYILYKSGTTNLIQLIGDTNSMLAKSVVYTMNKHVKGVSLNYSLMAARL